MKIIELEKSKRLKISFEKISELTLSEYKSSEVLIASNNSALNSERSFVLELVLPTNSSYYAALGAKYIPSEGYNNLIIEVRYTENYVENYSTSFAYDEKTVFKGLPKEYVETLLKTAANYLQADGIGIPCGKIVFDSAAYCEVGSSP
ncbi:MAG: hypothetical protein FWH52_07595, partial [Synergistaceae bacterium]|nr:hypothetical protein [Synergistaceae bacterium]